MSIKIYEPIIHILPSPSEADFFTADIIKDQIKRKPASVLSLPTGSTPLGMYQNLVRMYANKEINFSKVTIFNLDEYWPIKKDHESSYAYYMKTNLIDHINLKKRNWNIPNGEASDSKKEAARYESKLQAAGRIDMAILGIGPGKTCHIGFNERGSAADSRVRYIRLADETKKTNKILFSNPDEMPDGAITQGVANILRAKSIILIAKGLGKAWGINRALSGEINPDTPASFLRLHPHVTVILDQEAAKLLD